MNYQFAFAAQDFFVDRKTKITPTEFSKRLSRVVYNYPYQVSLVQQNLFDSHDTDRLASMFVNPDLPYDGANRLQDNGKQYSKRKPTPLEYRRMIQAIAMQMTFVGAPMLYYGTEAGMYSPDDPSNRQPMTWPNMKFDDPKIGFKQNIFTSVQKLIAIRNQFEALRTGLYRPVYASDSQNVFAFVRELNNQHVYVILNRNKKTQTISIPVSPDDNGKQLVDLLGKDQVSLVMDQNNPAARPTLSLNKKATSIVPLGNKMTVKVPSFGTAIIVQKDFVH